MKKYDFIVVGSGCGLAIIEEAIPHDLKVALVDKGPLGGTCLNVGCIPSKMLIYVADRIMEAKETRKLGFRAKVTSVDFRAIMDRTRLTVRKGREHIGRSLARLKKLDYFQGEGYFIDDFLLEVNGERLKGKKIFLATGSRTVIPPIKGLSAIDYLTNESILELNEKPESLIIIGGGYIAVEFGHFFSAIGTRVIILEMMDRLILSEEPEIADVLKEQLSKRMEIHTGTLVEEIKKDAATGSVTVIARDKISGLSQKFTAQKALVAVGRRSNADLLKVESSGIELDGRGYIKVNGYLETTRRGIFAVGDANGRQMFTHVANREAMLAVDHVLHGNRQKMDYAAMPHAVFSYPQAASVGLAEVEARQNHKVLVGKTRYNEVAYGEAMVDRSGFAKVIMEEDSGKILGFHIIGPLAPVLIQEVVNCMASKRNVANIFNGVHIHPALSEIIPAALAKV